jgi:hypothetical protein
VSKGQAPAQSKKPSKGQSATTEPASDGGETTEPTPTATEPAGDGVETTEPTPAATEPPAAASEPASEPIVDAAPVGSETPTDGPIVLTGSLALAPTAGDLLAELRRDSSAPGVGVAAGAPSDKEGRKPASSSADDSGSLPPPPHAPAPAGATGASAGSVGGASGAFAALLALVALVPLALSGLLGFLVTPLRPLTLVADVQRPG